MYYSLQDIAELSYAEFGRRLGSRDKQKRKSGIKYGDVAVLGGAGVGAGVGYAANTPLRQLVRQGQAAALKASPGEASLIKSKQGRKVLGEGMREALKAAREVPKTSSHYGEASKFLGKLRNTSLRRTGLGAAIGVLGGASIGYGIKRYQDSKRRS